jgi:hypothetical protein
VTNFLIRNDIEMSWQIHHDIHKLLNETFIDSKTFIDKTFSYTKPVFRVMAYNEENFLIAHQAGFYPITPVFSELNIEVAGLGLYAALPQNGLSTIPLKIYKEALKELNKRGYSFALALSSNDAVIGMSKKQLNAKIVDIPVRGRGGYSKRSDKLIIVSTLASLEFSTEARFFIDSIQNINELQIKEDLF